MTELPSRRRHHHPDSTNSTESIHHGREGRRPSGGDLEDRWAREGGGGGEGGLQWLLAAPKMDGWMDGWMAGGMDGWITSDGRRRSEETSERTGSEGVNIRREPPASSNIFECHSVPESPCNHK